MKLMLAYKVCLENQSMPKNCPKSIQGFRVGQGCQSIQKKNLHLKVLHVKYFQQKEQTQSRFLYKLQPAVTNQKVYSFAWREA